MKLKVHLVFPGNCEEAFNTYREVLGGEIVFIFRKEENKSLQVPEAEKQKISHMILQTPNFELAGEDSDQGNDVIKGNNTKLVLVFYDLGEVHRIFNLLSEGGTVIAPLEKTFFCDAIGELIDRFGISWLIMMTDEDYKG